MREFTDSEGRAWIASVHEDRGVDYKGRFHLVLRPASGAETDADEVGLRDVCWNSAGTARRTLETMSIVELRRRLRSALGRSRAQTSP